MSIIVTDQCDNLKVYHYDDGTTDRELQNIRGIIKDGDKVVCKSFGYTPEVLASDSQKLNDEISPLVTTETKFFKAYEGTILRVWQYQDIWHLSTHRKINAFKSKWGHNSTYGELFCRALIPVIDALKNAEKLTTEQIIADDLFKTFVNALDKEKVYIFMLRSFKENRKVCNGVDEPTLYCIGSFKRDEDFKFYLENPETFMPTPELISTIDTPDDLLDHIEKINPREYQGVVLMNPDGSSGKVVNIEYDRLDKLRGNVPNVLHRYVQLRWNKETLSQYTELYPEHQNKFTEWETSMNHVVNNIMKKYIERYINHKTAILPPEQYKVVLELQDYYIKNLRAKKEKATTSHIWEILGKWTEREVNVLYTQYKIRESKTGNGNRMPDEMRSGIMKSIITNYSDDANNKEEGKKDEGVRN